MSAILRKSLILALCLSLLFWVLPAKPAQAVSTMIINVDSFADLDDFAPGNGVCSAGSIVGGPCTLRAAVVEASLNQPYYVVVINLPEGVYSLSIPPAGTNDFHSGDLDFPTTTSANTITIRGTGYRSSVIDAGLIDRIFEVGPNVPLTLRNLVLRDGMLASYAQDDDNFGGAILNYGNLNLDNVLMDNNQAVCAAAACPYVIGGGAIMNSGTIYMLDSTIQNCTAENGSAIFNTGGGNFRVRHSTIANNHARGSYTISNWAVLSLRNSTLYNNTASINSPSGISNEANLTIESSTISGLGQPAAIYMTSTSITTIQDTVIESQPGGQNCSPLSPGAVWISNGFNIYNDASCPLTSPMDLVFPMPLLGVFGWWGGPTQTLPPLPGMPIINFRPGMCMVSPDFPILPPNLIEDQRHVHRTDGFCDAGAFEGLPVMYLIYIPILAR